MDGYSLPPELSSRLLVVNVDHVGQADLKYVSLESFRGFLISSPISQTFAKVILEGRLTMSGKQT